MCITERMTEACYETAKSIFPIKDKITESAKTVEKETGMNLNSVKDYIRNFFSMINGEKVEFAMSKADAHYYFEHIYNDFGIEKLINAIFSFQRYLNCDNQNHPGLQELVNSFMNEYVFQNLKIGKIATFVLLPILNSNCLTEEEINSLQDKRYCNETFNLYIPVLKIYENKNAYRYYSAQKHLIFYGKSKFLVTNDWYEDEKRHNMKPLCDWILKYMHKLC